ncbi:MAG: hypothetical protein L0H64_06060 [Pseudonocardia sp.]|nr:hypothetical protein [Pseudonocardia sp.]
MASSTSCALIDTPTTSAPVARSRSIDGRPVPQAHVRDPARVAAESASIIIAVKRAEA